MASKPLPLDGNTKPVRKEIILPFPGGTPNDQPSVSVPDTRITGKYVDTRPGMQAQFNASAESTRGEGSQGRSANQMHRINERKRAGRLSTELK